MLNKKYAINSLNQSEDKIAVEVLIKEACLFM